MDRNLDPYTRKAEALRRDQRLDDICSAAFAMLCVAGIFAPLGIALYQIFIGH